MVKHAEIIHKTGAAIYLLVRIALGNGVPMRTPEGEGYGYFSLQAGRARRDSRLTEYTITNVTGRLRRDAQ